jgi:misacylated tRNA(Ala) deacylase
MGFSVRPLFAEDAYLSVAEGVVVALTEKGIILDQTNFYATSGGQPGDLGFLERADGSRLAVIATVTGETKAEIIHQLDPAGPAPDLGERLTLHIDWDRRYRLMRMHTACHLLSVVCPFPITGAAVGEDESRVDFDMTGASVFAEEVTAAMLDLVSANHPVFTQWIDEAELDANPSIVRSKNVRPPRGLGHIRLVCIGDQGIVDSQPCGGTHVSETAEVGAVFISKIENKGKENRRMRIRFATASSDRTT